MNKKKMNKKKQIKKKKTRTDSETAGFVKVGFPCENLSVSRFSTSTSFACSTFSASSLFIFSTPAEISSKQKFGRSKSRQIPFASRIAFSNIIGLFSSTPFINDLLTSILTRTALTRRLHLRTMGTSSIPSSTLSSSARHISCKKNKRGTE